MTNINQNMLRLAESQKWRYLWVNLLWSNNFLESLKYTLFRSRGFFARRVVNYSVDILEVIGVSLCASPDIFSVAGGITFASFLLFIFAESLIHTLRGALIQEERMAYYPMLFLSLVFVGIGYYVAFEYFGNVFHFFPLLVFVLSRIVTSIVRTCVLIRTAEINIRRRVFFPYYYNFAFLAGSAALVMASARMPELTALYLIVLGHFVLNICYSLLSLYLSKKAESLERLTSVNSETKGPISWRLIAERLTVYSSQFVQPIIILFSPLAGASKEAILWAWLVRPLFGAILARPYRALYIDLFLAILNKQWTLVRLRIRHAKTLSLILLSFGLAVTGLYVVRYFGQIDPYFFLWFVATLVTQLLVAEALALTVEVKVYEGLVFARVVLPIVSLVIATFLPVPLMFLLFVCEAMGLAVCLSSKRKIDYISTLESSLIAKSTTFEPIPGTVLHIQKRLRPILEKLGYHGSEYVVRLRESIRSHKKMTILLEQISSLLPPYFRMFAIDSRSLYLWSPIELETVEVRKILIKNYPILIDSVSSQGLLAQLKDIPSLELPSNVSQSALGKIGALELVSANLPGAQAGKWYSLQKSGAWVSATDTAKDELARGMYLLKQRVERSPFLFRMRVEATQSKDRHLVPLRPVGNVEAVFVHPAPSAELVEGLVNLSSRLLKSELLREASSRVVSAELWHASQTLLMQVCGNLEEIRFQVKPEQRVGEDEIIVTRTSDGEQIIALVVEVSNKKKFPETQSNRAA